ncbi:MAG TPA: hypothetical protein ENF47_03015 [Thermoprotei archaeon]|nr:hypothetical protein [Thermoprotei archaeon]
MSTDLITVFIDFVIPRNVVKKLLELDEAEMIRIGDSFILADENFEVSDVTVGRLTVVIDEYNLGKLKEAVASSQMIIIRTPSGDTRIVTKNVPEDLMKKASEKRDK